MDNLKVTESTLTTTETPARYQFRSTDTYQEQEKPGWSDLEVIHRNYAEAMRRRGREPLGEESFYRHFFAGESREKTAMYGDKNDGYLLGHESGGVFVPTHFAPSGLKAGYRLIKELMDSGIPTALFITDDLVQTIQKLPRWKVTPIKLNQTFRGKDISKQLVINNWRAVPLLASFYLKQTGNNLVSDVREKAYALMTKFELLWKKPAPVSIDPESYNFDTELEIEAAVADTTEENGEDLLAQSTLARVKDFKLFGDEDESDD